MDKKKFAMSRTRKKLLIFAAFLVIAEVVVFGAIQPLLVADMSVKAQLADSDASYAGYQIYRKIVAFSPLFYFIVFAFMFKSEIKRILGGTKKDEKTN